MVSKFDECADAFTLYSLTFVGSIKSCGGSLGEQIQLTCLMLLGQVYSPKLHVALPCIVSIPRVPEAAQWLSSCQLEKKSVLQAAD